MAFAGALVVAATTFGTAGRPAAAAPAPLKIALITSESGVAASGYQGAPQGFLARIALQNAEGGVHGHKLVPLVINDQSSLTTEATGVQDAIAKGAIGIVSDTALFFAGYKYAQAAGIPVTGASFDGPEWGEQPDTNMFASDTGSIDPSYPANTIIGKFMRSHGGTVLGSYAYGISPSSIHSAEQTADSFEHAGGKLGVLDTSVPLGGVDFTAAALTAKQHGVNTVYGAMQNNSNFALLTSMKQAGVKLKVVVLPTGYEQDIVHTPAWADVQGAYFLTEFRPYQVPDAATRRMAAALDKYEHRPPADFPTIDLYESWLGADLMIKGIQLAGNDPTPAKVIKALRGVKAYNGGGILPISIDYATIFGHDPPRACDWFLQAKKQGFVAATTKPICGTDIPGTATASG